MLTEEKIKQLVADLDAAHVALIGKQIAVQKLTADLAEMEAEALDGVTLIGSTQKDRDREAILYLNGNEDIRARREELRFAENAILYLKAGLDITRTTISLWKALAYQGRSDADPS